MLTDGRGIPLGLAVDGANRHDFKLAIPTFESMLAAPSAEVNLCLDKGYDYKNACELFSLYGFIAHIRARGEEARAKANIPGYRARRWVVERTHSWINRFRRLLVRWEIKTENYLAMLHLACAWHSFRAAGIDP